MKFGGAKRLLVAGLAAAIWLPSSTTAFITQEGGGYLATTDVSETLLLALDMRDMRSTGDDFAAKKNIYLNGKNSRISLSSLSTDAKERWQHTPMFNLYRDGFEELGEQQEHDTIGDFDGAPVDQYADRLVLDLFDLEIKHIEADGALVYNVLMAFWGLLFDTLETCKNAAQHQNAALKMHTFLDQAAALWVGETQVRGQSGSGYMLYNLAQAAGERFNQDDRASEVRVNTLVLEALVDIQNKINKNECSTGVLGYVSMRGQVHALIKYSNTAVVQKLLNVLEENNSRKADYVEMYTLALLPQVAVCDRDAYESLLKDAVAQSISETTKQSLISALQSSYSCFQTDCELVGAYEESLIPQCNDRLVSSSSFAGYVATTDVRRQARLDRDLAYMSIFMRWDSFGSAEDVYRYGWNSKIKLQDLVLDLTSANLPVVSDYKQYFSEEYQPDIMIMSAFEQATPFASAKNEDRADLIHSVLRGTVMYWAIHEQLTNAQLACGQGDIDGSREMWDYAVAYFVGSTEKEAAMGMEGHFLFAVSKLMCDAFGTCEPNTSVANTEIMASFQTGLSLLNQQECSELSSLISNTIDSQLLVILSQATIASAGVASEGNALAYSRAILPAINKANPTSASTINTSTSFFYSPATTNLEPFFGAFANALAGMGVKCEDMGEYKTDRLSRGFCPSDVTVTAPLLPTTPTTPTEPGPQPAPQPVPGPVPQATASPTESPIFVPEPHDEGIAWGRFLFTNKQAAENDSKFSLDVKAMYQAATPGDAETIYTRTASLNVPSGLYGNPQVRNLQEMSTRISSMMAEDPMYAFYRVALYDDDSFDGGSDASGWPFADSVVRLALAPKNGNDSKLGAQTTVAMNIWMMIVHRLYQMVRDCKVGTKSLDLLDSTVGLWIGQEQAEGKFNSGWSVYALAQTAAKRYGVKEGEALVNKKLMRLFSKAQTVVGTCKADNDAPYMQLRFLVDEIVRQLSVPLLQNLLYYMSVDNFEYVELYALSFIPQVISCNEGTYDDLKNALYSEFSRDYTVNDDLLDGMGRALSCLKLTCEDLGDISEANGELASVVDELCYRLGNSNDNLLVAGYLLSDSVFQLDRVDLDIHQMDLFMRVGAYDLATNLYEYGRNSFLNEALDASNSIKSLVDAMPTLDTIGVFGMYESYFTTPKYAEQNILSALGRGQSGRFAGASRRQLSEVVLRTSQVMISYIHVIARLRSAIKLCTSSQGGQDEVDEAVALFVGSMEGRASGGDPSRNGKMLFALAKEVCSAFDRCESHGDATSNEFLMFAFDDMKQYLDTYECDKAKSVLEDSILPMMQVPLIQGTLFFAQENQGLLAQAGNSSLAAGDVLSASILPYVDQVDKSSAAVISENMEFSRSEKPVSGGAVAVFDAFAQALPAMEIDCNNVGKLGGLSTCGDANPHPSTPTNLGDDLYVTTTYVVDRANIALDIRDMEELLTDGSSSQAALLYEEGRNSEIFDKFGKRLGKRSLAGFAKNASYANPLYAIAVYALKDDNGQYLGKDARFYPDTIVKEMLPLSAQTKTPLAAEAALVLNVWMELAKELHETVTRCKEKVIKDEDGVHSIDEAVAYWIGDGQVAGDKDKGHLLYALAEQMGEHFGLNDGGQSRTNENILRLFHQAAIELALPNACSESPTTAKRVRHIVDKITTQMMIVNMQGLIHSLRTDNRPRAKVFAHAVVPLVAGCSPEKFKYLRAKLLERDFIASDVEGIIKSLYSTFPCFGIQCDDIGVHETEEKTSCVDPTSRTALAGYTPFTNILEFAKLDLDILEMSILIEMGSTEAALDVYNYGKHVSAGDDRTSLSLHFLATSSGRSAVPQFESFRRYFNGDEKYADTLVKSAMWDVAYTTAQRRTIVVDTCRVMIMYMAALQSMYEADNACREGGPESQISALQYWDIAAAFLIGHLEGSAPAGSKEGLFFWGLAKELCLEFGACSPDVSGSAIVNDKISTLLYSGRGAIEAGNCYEVRRAGYEIEPLLTVSPIQASLSAASKLSRKDKSVPTPVARAQAYVYSLSVLPLIAEQNREAADIIAKNLNMIGTPLGDGLSSVALSFSKPLDRMGIDCLDVGVSSDIDACTGVVYAEGNKAGLVISILVGTLAGILLIFILFRRRRRKERQAQDEAAEFVEPKGTSDLVPDQPVSPADGADSDTDPFVEGDADAAAGEHDGEDDQYMDAINTTKASNIV